jgi:hypothetical protein
MVTSQDTTRKEEIEAYYHSLSEREKQGFHVATTHLGETFDVVKTRGFLAWKANVFEQQQRLSSTPP